MMDKKVVKELLNESACAHSASKKSACNRPKPGNASGGCAFEGSQISLFPYDEAIHLVHSPSTCLGASWGTRETPSSANRGFTKMGFCTDISENDVIFGGERKLKESLEYLITHYAPKAAFVYETCVCAMIGDDTPKVCKEAEKRFGIPVVLVRAAGFVGSKNLGSRIAGEELLEQLIGRKEPEILTPYDINLIGEYNVTGDMWRYKPLLDELGIRVLGTLSGDGRIDSIMQAHRAKLNVLVCAKSLVSLARKMEERYGIPYISASFYGMRESSRSLLSIVKALGDVELIEKAKTLIEREERKCVKNLEPYMPILLGKKAVLNTGGNKAWSIASALQDLGVEVVATSVRKCTEDDKARCRELLGEGAVLMENPGAEQYKVLEEKGADMLLAGGRSLYGAIKRKVAFVDVNQEKHTSYGAYDGLVAFAKDLSHSLCNPVFKLVSQKAPWE